MIRIDKHRLSGIGDYFYVHILAVVIISTLLFLAIPPVGDNAYADPPLPDDCKNADPSIYIGCHDTTMEAVQDSLLNIEEIVPNNTPSANGTTTYTVRGRTIAKAVKSGARTSDDVAKLSSNDTVVDWTEFTIIDDSDDRDVIGSNGISVTWGGIGQRTLVVRYETLDENGNKLDSENSGQAGVECINMDTNPDYNRVPGDSGVPDCLTKSLVVNIKDAGNRPPPGTQIPGGDGSDPDPKGTCTVAAWNEHDCISQGGKWLANTGVDSVIWPAIGVALLVLLFALLLRRRKKKEDEVVISA